MRKMISSLVIIIAVVALVGCGKSNETSQEEEVDFPTKDIKVIVPKDPGGGTDIVARGLVEYTKDKFDKNIIVENQPGGGGVTGMVQGAESSPDGYTLTMTTVELAILPHMELSPVTYENFTGIVSAIADPASVIVPSDAPYDTLEEFINYSKDNKGLKVGNSGIGSIWHLAAVAVEDEFDLDFNHIPYDGGSAPAVAALAGGHLDAIMVAPGNAKSQIDAGDLKVLAVMSDERLDSFPDVPTFKEEIDMDFTVQAWAALTAPADIPKEALNVLSEAFTETLNDEEFQDFLIKQGIEPVQYGPEETQKMMEEDHKRYGELMKEIDL